LVMFFLARPFFPMHVFMFKPLLAALPRPQASTADEDEDEEEEENFELNQRGRKSGREECVVVLYFVRPYRKTAF
jgi:hypothetical protein